MGAWRRVKAVTSPPLYFGLVPRNPGLDYRTTRGYLWATVDEPAGALCVPGWRLSSRDEALSAHVAPAGICLVGLLVSPHTMLPGGRGPRRVAPVRRAGRSTILPNPSQDRGIGRPRSDRRATPGGIGAGTARSTDRMIALGGGFA